MSNKHTKQPQNQAAKPEPRVIRIKLPTASAMSAMSIPVSIIFAGILISVSVISVGGSMKDALKNSTGTTAAPTAANNNAAAEPTTATVSLGSMTREGSSDAKVAIVEFSDFECPYCGKYYDEAGRNILADYIKTNKVQMYYRHLPLSFHPSARPLAEASVCANEQGKFWEFHDSVFEKVLANNRTVPAGVVAAAASDTGIDQAKLNDCINTKRLSSIIDTDSNDAQSAGINGTPGFVVGKIQDGKIVNGTIVSGAQPYSAFQAAINQYL
jgi:protein-disulfide isomerase